MSKIDTTEDHVVGDYTVATLAKAEKVSESTVRQWIRNGTISAYRLGPRLLRIPATERDKLKTPTGLNAYLDK